MWLTGLRGWAAAEVTQNGGHPELTRRQGTRRPRALALGHLVNTTTQGRIADPLEWASVSLLTAEADDIDLRISAMARR
jgi:hypothetical protein